MNRKNFAIGVGLNLLVLFAFAAPLAAGPPTYYVVDVGVLPGAENSNAYAINEAGDVVGTSFSFWIDPDGIIHIDGAGYLFSDGQLTDLGTLGHSTAVARGLNASRQVVGYSGESEVRGFLWQDGEIQALDMGDGVSCKAYDINDSGLIVGVRYSGGYWPCLWQNGVLMDLGVFESDWGTYASAVNNVGQVVGQLRNGGAAQAFLWDSGEVTELPPLAGSSRTEANDINDAGTIVGTSGYRAVRWVEGRIELVATTPVAQWDAADAINNNNQVVGAFYWISESRWAAATWWDGATYNLNHLIPPGSGWRLKGANDINDSGLIAAGGYHEELPSMVRAVRLVPVDADIDGDEDVDLDDLALLAGCMSGPRAIVDPGCAPADLDRDGDVDLYDFRAFQVAVTWDDEP